MNVSRGSVAGPGRRDRCVQAAGDEYTLAPTPQARAAMDAAFREYVRRLAPVIGQVEASRYEASLAAYEKVLDRVEALTALRARALPSTPRWTGRSHATTSRTRKVECDGMGRRS